MKKLIPILAAAFGLILLAAPALSAQQLKTAVFAGGCFWSMQHDMEPIKGVVSTVVGYTGGHVANPTYEQVSTERTGHYESVKVTYDPSKISYPQLVAAYLRTTDPTDDGGAFCDRGPSYRPAIFVADDNERKAAEAAIAQAQPLLKKKIVTAVLPLGPFYMAEEYHQHYARKNPVYYAMYRQGCGKDRIIKAVWQGR
ncbi:MAG: peptide-methionine (S)-S-oxide reductase MsrA [Caulobacteraceae bacterium]